MLRHVHPNALRSHQHQRATSLLSHCVSFHSDWDILKWQFAPTSSSLDIHRFDAITGGDDYSLAILRDKIMALVQLTKDALEGKSDKNYTERIKEASSQLDWMLRKTRDLKIELEGEGKRYRDGKPRFRVIGASKEVVEQEVEVEMEDIQESESSGMFELVSADHSQLEQAEAHQQWRGFG